MLRNLQWKVAYQKKLFTEYKDFSTKAYFIQELQRRDRIENEFKYVIA